MLLEWTDDLETYILKGYGNSLNYRMGLPLLEDVVQSMEQAIQAEKVLLKISGTQIEQFRRRVGHLVFILPHLLNIKQEMVKNFQFKVFWRKKCVLILLLMKLWIITISMFQYHELLSNLLTSLDAYIRYEIMT
ncbi:hypothetical protein HN51_007222 [Arachis hypogaea]